MEDQLREAVTMGLVAEVDRLLQKGVNPHTLDDNGSSLLHLACSVGDLKMLQLLLKYPLDIESTDESGSTPLHVAYVIGLFQAHILDVFFSQTRWDSLALYPLSLLRYRVRTEKS